jgi:multicomponent Na+:H+ antiporter subunit G
MGEAPHLAVEIATAVAMVLGAGFMLLTGIGLLRMPDVYTRMHAAGKAGTVGVAFLILAPTIFFAGTEPSVTVRGILAIVFQLYTTPGATYLLAHACYVTSYPTHDGTELDEMKDWVPVYSDEDFGHE